jgi:hypothetical protein
MGIGDLNLGVMLTCFNEVSAVNNAIANFRLYYPENKIYLVTESSENYDHLCKFDSNISVSYEEDTMSFYYNNPSLYFKWREQENQEGIKKAMLSFLDRVDRAIDFCQSDYMLLMDPDVLIRGVLNIEGGNKLLGSLNNKGVPEETKEILEGIEGAIAINEWGATPAIFESETFKKAYSKFKSIPDLCDKLTMSWSAMYAHDVIIPVLFSLIGEREKYNPDFTECNTDPTWKNNGKLLVHHYKKYYPDCENKYPWFSE